MQRASIPLLGARQQLADPGAGFVRAVQLKENLRRAAEMKPVCDLMPNISRRGHQSFQATLALFVTSVHRYENPRRARILGQLHSGHAGQPNTRIAQLAFDDGFNLLPQGLPQALTVVFCPSLLHAHLLDKTDENIRNRGQRLVKGMMRWIGVLWPELRAYGVSIFFYFLFCGLLKPLPGGL